MFLRETEQHRKPEAQRVWRLLSSSLQEEALRRIHQSAVGTSCFQQQNQAKPCVQQQPHSQPDGQEACDPHAVGHRGAFFPLLDTRVCSERLEGIWQTLGWPSTLRSSHLLHSPALIHLCMRQPNHLLLHEQALSTRHASHLLLLHRTGRQRGPGQQAPQRWRSRRRIRRRWCTQNSGRWREGEHTVQRGTHQADVQQHPRVSTSIAKQNKEVCAQSSENFTLLDSFNNHLLSCKDPKRLVRAEKHLPTVFFF